MLSCWNRKCKTIEEQRLLEKAFIETGKDSETLEYAFKESVKYDKTSFAYILKIIENKNKEKLLAAAKKREQQLSLKKIEEAKSYKPNLETAEMLKGLAASLKPGQKKKAKKPELTKEEKLKRRRLEDEFKREVKK
jgi:hypothetical protein